MSVPELVPEILATAKLLQRKVLLVVLVSMKLSCRSGIPVMSDMDRHRQLTAKGIAFDERILRQCRMHSIAGE